jgi:Ca2+-transporting ATPase
LRARPIRMSTCGKSRQGAASLFLLLLLLLTECTTTTTAFVTPAARRLFSGSRRNRAGRWAIDLRGGAQPTEKAATTTTTTTALASSPTPSSTATSVTARATPTSTQTWSSYNASGIDAGSTALDDLYQALQSRADGLSQSQAAERLSVWGPNALTAAAPKSLWKLVLEQFEDRLVQILLGVAVVSALFSLLQVQQQQQQATAALVGATTVQAIVESEALWKAFVEPAVILAILVVNALIGVIQSRSADDSLAALQAMQSSTATVLRDGVSTTVPATTLVAGDVVQVRPGDKVPADGRVLTISTSRLQVDEGALTGESETVSKRAGAAGRTAAAGQALQDQRGMVYSGTVVTSGSALVLVTATAMATQFGRIQAGVTAAAADAPKTPLALKLDEFGAKLTWMIGAICLAVWIISIPKMNDPSFGNSWEGAIYYAKVSVALGVAAIPEGLPAVITLCLSLGTRRMAERNVLVRKLPSVETLGCTSVICTDKTGTLTTNEMTAVSLVLAEHENGQEIVGEHAIQGVSYSPFGTVQGIAADTEVHAHPLGAVADVAAVAALCNDAKIVGHDHEATSGHSGSKKKEGKTFERIGEPTEAALCVLAEKLGGMSHYLESGRRVDENGLHVDVPPSTLASANVASWRDAHARRATLEFTRDRKSMSVLCDFPHGDYPSTAEDVHEGVASRKAGNRLLIKGAPNLLIERCTHIKFRDGTVAKMTGPLRRLMEEKVSEMAARPLRCLALAVKEHGQLEDSLKDFIPHEDSSLTNHALLSNSSHYKAIESGLTLVGVVGIKDPARPEVAESINQCTKAGIRVMMITGDARDTAVAIARDVNIFPKESDQPLKAYEGREFFQKSDREQLEILREDNIVFCRAEPADKQKLIKLLQSLDEIVAMTGDVSDGTTSILSLVSSNSSRANLLLFPLLFRVSMMHPPSSRLPLELLWVSLERKSPKRPPIWFWRTTTLRLLSALWKRDAVSMPTCRPLFAF